ncbi:MAG: hypothetical protein IJA62_04000 [Ruminococcus sp.]|nr:hypothetical protein [Ruminococcus sp.]
MSMGATLVTDTTDKPMAIMGVGITTIIIIMTLTIIPSGTTIILRKITIMSKEIIVIVKILISTREESADNLNMMQIETIN